MYVKIDGIKKHIDFILLDIICTVAAFIVAFRIRIGNFSFINQNIFRMVVIVTCLMVLMVAASSHIYSRIIYRGYFQEFTKVLLMNVILLGGIAILLFVMKNGDDISRIAIVNAIMIDVVLQYLDHILWKKVIRRNGKKKKIILITSRQTLEENIDTLLKGDNIMYDFKGIFIDEDESEFSGDYRGIPILGHGKEVYEYMISSVVDEVLIFSDRNYRKIEPMAHKILSMGITVNVEIQLFEKTLPNTTLQRINGINVLTTTMKSVTMIEMLLKRIMDVAAGIVGCIITLVLFIFIAPAIKIADPKGGIFFSQVRVGRNGRKFRMYKFRSMYTDAEERKKELMSQNEVKGLMFKMESDPRIIGSGKDGTKKGLGHFIRATSLDEFPNFWSILKGDMSLVGTRPPTLDEYERYDLHHKSRLSIKPGLTGMWQVSGRSDIKEFEDIVELDNEYIRNWNIGLDIKIVLKTIIVVIKGTGSR